MVADRAALRRDTIPGRMREARHPAPMRPYLTMVNDQTDFDQDIAEVATTWKLGTDLPRAGRRQPGHQSGLWL